MTQHRRPATSIPAKFGDHSRRLSDLERARTGVDDTPERTITFTLAGAVYVSDSPPYEFARNRTLVEVKARLATAGTGSTVIGLKKNGSSIGSITLASGVAMARLKLATTFAGDNDYLTVHVTAAGATAAGLAVYARYR